MVMDLKLLTVILCVLVLCDQAFTSCTVNAKRCKRKGGQCYRKNEIPSGVPILEGCQGNCKCYREVESIPTFPSAMANMTNMKNMTNMTNVPNMDNLPNMTKMMNMTEDRQRTGYSCDVNGWESPQYCKCMQGQRISKFESNFDNGKKDRQWHLQCSDRIPNDISKHTSLVRYRTGYNNEWDGVFSWGGSSNTWCYMVGMRSYHDNQREDRRYEVYFSCSDQWTLTDCSGWQWLNSWGGQVNHVLGSTQVIAGLYSYHDNNREDRRFAIMVCDLVPKCDQRVQITYDYGKKTVTENEGRLIAQETYECS